MKILMRIGIVWCVCVGLFDVWATNLCLDHSDWIVGYLDWAGAVLMTFSFLTIRETQKNLKALP